MYQPRQYRHWITGEGLVSFIAVVGETDLWIRARSDLGEEARGAIVRCRAPLERYIVDNPDFLTSLHPIPVAEDAADIVKEMAQAASRVGVGPMAAVAGAIAERVGRELLRSSPEVIVENGGDIFMKVEGYSRVGIYAGDSPFSGRLCLEVAPEDTPLGICTSSGTVGHSLSFGRADAVIVLSPCTALADAAATAIGNMVKEDADIARGLECAQGIEGLRGLVIIRGPELGVWGAVKLSAVE